MCYPSFTYEISLLISSRLEDKISSQGWTTMADDVLKTGKKAETPAPHKHGLRAKAQEALAGKGRMICASVRSQIMSMPPALTSTGC